MSMLVFGLLLAAPAAAHGRSSDATNFDSRILSTPDVAGVSWRIYGGDEYLAVSNDSGAELLVLGYEDEPWLRVGPDGVFENQRSAATYVNDDRYANVQIPAHVDPEAPPEWEQVSSGTSWYWHDHRTHWMAPTPPPAVRAAPRDAQVVQDWEVPIEVGETAMSLQGELWWIPAPSPVPWLLIGAALTLPALLGLLRARSPGGPGDPVRLIRPAAGVLLAVAAINLVHLADDLFAAPAPVSAKILAATQTAIFIAVAVFGGVRAWQAREGAFTALGVGSVAAFVGQGLLYLPALTSSQLQSVAPDIVGRLAIAVSLVQLLPVGLIAVIGTRRMLPDVDGVPSGENEHDQVTEPRAAG